MRHEKGRWALHPGATPAASLPPVEPGRVVGLGAICDLGTQGSNESRDQSFSVSEFVKLEDGRRVILHQDRGFTIGLRSTGGSGRLDLRVVLTLESLTEDVMKVVLPDDDAPTEAHPWTWLADLARARGLNVSADDLRSLRYEVIFTDRVRTWLAAA